MFVTSKQYEIIAWNLERKRVEIQCFQKSMKTNFSWSGSIIGPFFLCPFTKIDMNWVCSLNYNYRTRNRSFSQLYHYNYNYGPLVWDFYFLMEAQLAWTAYYQPKVITRLVFSLQIVMENSDNAQINLRPVLTRTRIIRYTSHSDYFVQLIRL